MDDVYFQLQDLQNVVGNQLNNNELLLQIDNLRAQLDDLRFKIGSQDGDSVDRSELNDVYSQVDGLWNSIYGLNNDFAPLYDFRALESEVAYLNSKILK